MPQATQPASTKAPMGTQYEDGQTSSHASDTQLKVLRDPPTGKEFLEKLRDGRVIYFDGKLVKDVTTHPAFATSARSASIRSALASFPSACFAAARLSSVKFNGVR